MLAFYNISTFSATITIQLIITYLTHNTVLVMAKRARYMTVDEVLNEIDCEDFDEPMMPGSDDEFDDGDDSDENRNENRAEDIPISPLQTDYFNDLEEEQSDSSLIQPIQLLVSVPLPAQHISIPPNLTHPPSAQQQQIPTPLRPPSAQQQTSATSLHPPSAQQQTSATPLHPPSTQQQTSATPLHPPSAQQQTSATPLHPPSAQQQTSATPLHPTSAQQRTTATLRHPPSTQQRTTATPRRRRTHQPTTQQQPPSDRRRTQQQTAPSLLHQAQPPTNSWSTTLQSFTIKSFSSYVGPTVPVPETASEIFSLMFTEPFLDQIVAQTNLYAKQTMGEEKYDKWDKITREELRAYIGFCILMGITIHPVLDDYWSTDPVLHYPAIADSISRDRFREISRYLHFVDNTSLPSRGSPGYDRLGKVGPIIDHLSQSFVDLYEPHKEVAVDEAMIKFTGQSSIKQYMHADETYQKRNQGDFTH